MRSSVARHALATLVRATDPPRLADGHVTAGV